jgi:3-isopropylmalate/(R)-2-methylmalate dehydratase small subunit
LLDFGFRAVIAPRLADIFKSNALRNGLVPVEVESSVVSKLVDAVRADPTTEITVDVASRTVTAPGIRATFALDDFSRTRLVEGLDDIALTLRHEAEIAAFEKTRPEWLPRVR